MMQRNVTIKKCCFSQYDNYELIQAAQLRNGGKRFEMGKTYELKYERAEDWETAGWCTYAY